MNIAICDDNECDALTARKVIRDVLNELSVSAEIAYYLKAEDIQEKLIDKKEPLDILILDIDMPKISGLQLAEKLRENNINLIIIFLSAYEDFVFKAIEFQPFRYIRKIRIKTEMPIAIRSAVKLVESNRDKQIILNTDNGEMKVMISEIVYYEMEKRKISVHLNDGRCLLVNKTIADMREIIKKDNFIMIHRSCVVNEKYIKNVQKSIVVLENDEKLIISRPRYKEVKQQLLKIWSESI